MEIFCIANDPSPWKDRVCRSVRLIESERDAWMEEATLIGRVSRQTKEAKWHIRLKSVQFSWQRGVKIGKLMDMALKGFLYLSGTCASVYYSMLPISKVVKIDGRFPVGRIRQVGRRGR